MAASSSTSRATATTPERVLLRGMPPVGTPDARILILGSMPGAASLGAARYYAHPRNAFWPILTQLFGWPDGLDYAARLEALRKRRVALWDVVHECVRPGSLDSSIDAASVQANDLPAFLAAHPHIVRICLNGTAAHTLFRRHVLARHALPGDIELLRLPSTSPAHAAMTMQAKLSAWRDALAPVLG